jgi:hypothetical protein
MKPGGPINQISHAGVRYHRGYVYDKLRHTVLTTAQMSKTDRAFVEATLKTITTGPEAMTLPQMKVVEHEDGSQEEVVNNWSCTEIGDRGKVYVVSYHGIEVALFFKRQLTEVKLDPGDRQPEGVMQDPSEAWQRLDILGQSAKKANFVLTTTLKRLDEENKFLKKRISTLEELNGRLETEAHKRENKVVKRKRRRR